MRPTKVHQFSKARLDDYPSRYPYTTHHEKKTPHAFGGKLVRLLKLVLILLFASFDFGSALYRRFVSEENGGTSVIAHSFGFLAGFLVGFSLLRNERTEKWETVLKFSCLAVFLVLFVAGLGINFAGYRGLVGSLSLWSDQSCFILSVILSSMLPML